MEMFHINPKDGNVGVCRAKGPESCPFGEEISGIETHYEDPDEARSNAEWLMAEKHKRYDYNSGLSKRERSAADDAMRNAPRIGVVPPDKIKSAIAGFEVKSPYSSSMRQTYSGGIGEFVRQLTKNHNGGVSGRSGEMPIRTEVGEVLFKSKSGKRLEFYIDGKPYAIDRKKRDGYTDYSDPYPLS